MREIRNIVEDVIAVIEAIGFPLSVTAEFPNELMDMPLNTPLITVGIAEIEIDSSAAACYSGKSGTEKYSLPADITVELNIHIPHDLYGLVNYDVMSMVLDALHKSNIEVYKMTTEKMYYNSTFLCIVYPVRFKFREHICGDSQ